MLIFAGSRAQLDDLLTAAGCISPDAVVVDAMEGTDGDGTDLLAHKLDTHRVIRALIVAPQVNANIPYCGDDADAMTLFEEVFRTAGLSDGLSWPSRQGRRDHSRASARWAKHRSKPSNRRTPSPRKREAGSAWPPANALPPNPWRCRCSLRSAGGRTVSARSYRVRATALINKSRGRTHAAGRLSARARGCPSTDASTRFFSATRHALRDARRRTPRPPARSGNGAPDAGHRPHPPRVDPPPRASHGCAPWRCACGASSRRVIRRSGKPA